MLEVGQVRVAPVLLQPGEKSRLLFIKISSDSLFNFVGNGGKKRESYKTKKLGALHTVKKGFRLSRPQQPGCH